MAGASLVIALTPPARVIGVGAALLVVAARLVQGISMGGETTAAAVYVAETAPPRHRFLFSALAFCGALLGNLGAIAVTSTLSRLLGRQALVSYGWRGAFLIAAVLGVSALWIRRSVDEPEVFRLRVVEAAVRPPAGPILRRHWRPMVLGVFVAGGTVAAQTICTLYLPQYAAAVGAGDVATTTGQLLAVFPILLLTLLGAGMAADRWGTRWVVRAGCVLLTLAPVPLLTALAGGKLAFLTVAALYAIPVGMSVGLVPAYLATCFPISVRALGSGIPYAVGGALFGGSFPLLAQTLVTAGSGAVIPWLAAGLAAMAAGAAFLLGRSDQRTTDLGV